MLKQVQLALAALLLTGALTDPSAAQQAASDQCGEYYGCFVYGPWLPRTR